MHTSATTSNANTHTKTNDSHSPTYNTTQKTTQRFWLSLEWTEKIFILLLPRGVALELHYLLLLGTACLHNF